MTDLETVQQHLDALSAGTPADLHGCLAVILDKARFAPRPERRECFDTFALNAERDRAAPTVRASAMFLQGMDRFMCEEHDVALRYFAGARALFADVDDSEGLGLCGMSIGAVYRTYGNFDLAMKALVEGFERLKASGRYPMFLAATANSMANIHHDMGNYAEAQSMFDVTLEESTKAKDFYFHAYALQGLGRVHLLQGRRAEAEDALQRSLTLAEAHNNPTHITTSLTELASLHFRAGDLQRAEELSRRALAIREDNHLLGGAITNCLRLAEIHMARQEWGAARAILERALGIAEELKVKLKLAQVHEMLAMLSERTGDAAGALEHYKAFHTIRAQVEQEDSARKLADARRIFEAEQTRKENAIIRQQKAEIERKNIELQDTVDELTRAKIGRKARAMTLGLTLILFVFQDAILVRAIRAFADTGYFGLLAVKMAIIFSLAPINQGIERFLLRRVTRQQKRALAAAQVSEGVGGSPTAVRSLPD